MESIRDSPIQIGTFEELIDDHHAIVSQNETNEQYVCILSFVDRDLLVLGCSVLMHYKVPVRVYGLVRFIHGSIHDCANCVDVNLLISVLFMVIIVGTHCRSADWRRRSRHSSDAR